MQIKTIEKRIEEIKNELMQIGDMRPGSLSEQYSACQKKGCKCVDPENPQKHGPFYQLSYTHQGKSTTRFIRPQFVADIRKELKAYKRFKDLTQQWVTLAIDLSKAKMELARQSTPKQLQRKPRS